MSLRVSSKLARSQRVKSLLRLFKKYYPEARCALHHSSPEELLIATILSAQCTDERVNIVTEKLFKKYPTVKSFADSDLDELEKDIHSTGFYKNKAKNIKKCCSDLVSLYDSKVPQNMKQLVALAGVGRKTANVVLGNAFGVASGVVVDTHVTRLTNRLDLARGQDAVKLEKELNELIPKKDWIEFPHWMIHHGRQVCKARKPRCETCFLEELCPQRGV